ncbi:MAG: hypothetical protein ACRDZO_15815, partial [Egibacteraceae bacterium]
LVSRTNQDTTGRSHGRQWGILVAAHGDFRGRLWGFSHGRRQPAPVTAEMRLVCRPRDRAT